MLKNYIKIAWRNIVKRRSLAAINLLCLSIGSCFALVVGVYIAQQKGVNQQFRNIAHQYILRSNWKGKDMGSSVTNPASFSKALKEEYPNLIKNYYRYKIYVNGDPDIAIYTDNDDFTDGRYVSRPFFSDSEIEPGDQITMEMYNIDAGVHLYFYSLAQSGNGDEASATPANPVSNFTGGCLGYFSVQTKQTQTKVIP